jgi:DNA replication protein DnaC
VTLEGWKAMGDPVLVTMAKAGGDFVREIKAKAPPRWLTLWGTSGSGKTYLARIIHGLFPGKAHWLDWVDLCRRYQAKEETANRIRWAADAPLVVLDDIGAEHQTPATVGLTHSLLHSRLNRWTIITSNLSPDDWSIIDARIGSRLVRGGNKHVECRTQDFATRRIS